MLGRVCVCVCVPSPSSNAHKLLRRQMNKSQIADEDSQPHTKAQQQMRE